MASITFPPCPWNVTDATLSDWRDHLLSATEDSRLADHVPTCAGCQARLSGFERAERALRGQRIPDLQERIWRGMQGQLAQLQRRRMIPLKRVSIIGAMTATVLVVLFVVFLVTNRGAANSLTTFVPQQTPTSAIQPTSTPSLSSCQQFAAMQNAVPPEYVQSTLRNLHINAPNDTTLAQMNIINYDAPTQTATAFVYTFCSSAISPNNLLAFYQKNLPQMGWAITRTIDFSNYPDVYPQQDFQGCHNSCWNRISDASNTELLAIDQITANQDGTEYRVVEVSATR